MIIHTPITLYLGNAGRHESLVAGGGTPSTGPIIPHPDHFGHGSFERHEWHESDKSRLHFPFAHRIWMSFFLSQFVSFCYVWHCSFTCFCCQSHGGERMYICREMCHVPPSFHWVPRRRQSIWKGEGQRQVTENEDIAQRGQGLACARGPCMTRFVGTRGGWISWQAQFFKTSDSGIWSSLPGSYVHAVMPVWQAHYWTIFCGVSVCMGMEYSVYLHFVGDSGKVLCVSSGSWRYLCVAEGALGGLCFVNFCCCPSQQEGHMLTREHCK